MADSSDIAGLDYLGLKKLNEDFEISNLISASYDSSKCMIMILHPEGRLLSKELPMQLCEKIAGMFKDRMAKYPSVKCDVKIVQASGKNKLLLIK